MVYFSFEALPEIKRLNKKEKRGCYKQVNNSLKLGKKYSYIFFVATLLGLLSGRLLAENGMKGYSLGYMTLGVMFVTWMIGDLYLLNYKIRAELKKMNGIGSGLRRE